MYTLRRWLGDTDFSNVPVQPGQFIPRAQQTSLYSDQEYIAFINDKGGDLIYTWAHIMMAIAANNALLSVYVNLGGGGSVDFSRMPGLLMDVAKTVIEQYIQNPAEAFSEIDSGALSASPGAAAQRCAVVRRRIAGTLRMGISSLRSQMRKQLLTLGAWERVQRLCAGLPARG